MTWRLVVFCVLWGVLLAPLVIPVASRRGDAPATAASQLYFDVTSLLTMLAAAWIATRVFDRRSFQSLGFEPRAVLPDTAGGLLVACGMVGCAVAVGSAIGWVHIEAARSAIGLSFMLVTLSIAANSVAQELLFRGYMLQTIEAHSNRALAVAVSAVLFMAAHGGALLPAGIIPAANLLVAGILLGIAFTVARNLWLPIGLHFGWNFLQGPGLGLPVSGQDIHGGVALMQTTLTGPPEITGSFR